MSRLLAVSFLLLLASCSFAPTAQPPTIARPQTAAKATGPRVTQSRVRTGADLTLPTTDSYDRVVMADSPIAYWPLDDVPSTGVSIDLVGSRNGVIGNQVTSVASILPNATGTCLSFPGGRQTDFSKAIRVAQNAGLQPTTAISVEAWFISSHFTDGLASTGTILMYGDDANVEPWIYTFRWDGKHTYARFWVTRAGDLNETPIEATAALANNTLYHVVGTFDGSNLKIYLNTVPSTRAFVGTIDYSLLNGNGITIALRNNLRGDFSGQMCKVAMYNFALSPAQVTAHYNAGAIVGMGSPSPTPTPSPSPTATPTPTPSPTAPPTPTPTPSSGVDAYDQAVLSDSPIAYWPLNDLIGTSAHDVFGHNGTIGSALTLGAASILPLDPASTAIAYPGGIQTGYTKTIVVPQSAALQPTAAISTEAWLESSHFTDGEESTGTLWMYGDDASNEPWIYVWRWNGAQTFLRFYVTRASDHAQTYAESSVAMQNNVPTHVVGTYNGATIALYINGALVGTTAFVGTLDYSTTGSFGITMGLRNNITGDFGGTLQKMALYNYALSQSQISTHYAAGAGAGLTKIPALVQGR